MSNINKQAREKLKLAAAKAVDNFDPNMFVETRDVLALLDDLEAAEKRIAEHRKVLNSLAAVARRYLPDYDEHPEIQAADELLESTAGLGVKGE